MTHFTNLNQVLGKEALFGQDYGHVYVFEETHETWAQRDGVVEEVSSDDIYRREEERR